MVKNKIKMVLIIILKKAGTLSILWYISVSVNKKKTEFLHSEIIKLI